MYFPFLRGKQFELLALKDLSKTMSNKRSKISPIIEPVKKDLSGLSRSLTELAKNNINFNVIVNPAYGELKHKISTIIEKLKDSLKGYDNFQIAFIVNSDESWDDITNTLDYLEEHEFEYSGYTLIHEYQDSTIDTKASITSRAKYNVVNVDKTSKRYYRNFSIHTRVSLDDHFKSLPRNSDYRHIQDELFSEEHKYFSQEGFVGFSDYLTIGSSWSEGGFIPYAVVIHLTYNTGSAIRIRHFVCDSIDDPSDTAGKFSEALCKLVHWLSTNNCDTETTRAFKELHHNEYFPGLGTVKKMSIKHHIEIVLDSF